MVPIATGQDQHLYNEHHYHRTFCMRLQYRDALLLTEKLHGYLQRRVVAQNTLRRIGEGRAVYCVLLHSAVCIPYGV